MDDHKFDEHIKSKVGDYQDEEFDPRALAALHHQMATAKVWPWYSHYRTELIIGSVLLVCTLAIILNQRHTNGERARAIEQEILALKKQNEEVVRLREEIRYLKSVPPDTIHVVEKSDQSSTLTSVLLQRISKLENSITRLNENYESLLTRDVTVTSSNPASENNLYLEGNTSTLRGATGTFRLTPHAIKRESAQAEPNDFTKISSESNTKISAKTIRNIERHYRKGIGIKLGPVIEISKGIYSQGSGQLDISGGIMADFIVSPSLSLETGVKHVHRFYEISDKEDLSRMQLPGTDTNLGTLTNADVDSWIFEVPLNLKYRYPLSMKTHWLAGIGYSSLIYTKQILEYDYEFEANSPATISSSYEKNGVEVYPGMINISLGLNHQLKNRKNLETSIYFQRALGGMGIENNKSNYIGLRGIYWFTLR